MTMYFISTIKPYTSNCLKVELPYCCALQRLHDTDQHVSPVAITGETLVIVVLKQHAQNKKIIFIYLTFIPGRKHGSGTWFKKEHEKVASNLASIYGQTNR